MPIMLSNLFEFINKYLKGNCISLLEVSIVYNYESITFQLYYTTVQTVRYAFFQFCLRTTLVV